MLLRFLSRFRRRTKGLAVHPANAGSAGESMRGSAQEPVPPPPPVASLDENVELVAAKAVPDILLVEEVSNAEFYIGDLFRRRFGGDPPGYPRHFVAFYRASRETYQAVGYVNYLRHEDCVLCGGLVIDDRLYRKMAPEHRKLIKEAGGIAEIVLRSSFARLRDFPAIWGYVGNKLAEAVDLRAGFIHTYHQHVMVVWNHELSNEEKNARIERIVALGPF